jgi:predicted dehydrogenase
MQIAVVGAGFAGGIHAQAWAQTEGAELALVVDPDPSRAAEVADRFEAERSPSLEDALAPGIDAVSVCVPTAFHEHVARAVLEAGKPTLCEKPMALDVAACDRMIGVSTEAGVTLMVAHVLRFWPEYERLGRIVRDGSLGALRSLSCTRLVTRPGAYAPWLLDPSQGLGLGEVLIHDLDIAAALLGRPRSLVAQGARDAPGWSSLQVLLRFDRDVAVTVEAGWGTPSAEPFVAGFRAFFERGLVEYDSRRRPTFRVVSDDGVEEGDAQAGETEGGPWAFDVAGYLREVDYFSACVAEGRAPDRCPPEAGRQAVELVLAVFESAESGREVALP